MVKKNIFAGPPRECVIIDLKLTVFFENNTSSSMPVHDLNSLFRWNGWTSDHRQRDWQSRWREGRREDNEGNGTGQSCWTGEFIC